MWGMVTKKNKRSRRDSIVPGLQYPLWPNEDGLLFLPRPLVARSNVLLLPHLQPSPPRVRVSRLHLPRSRSLSLWLLERSSAAVGFGMARERHFEMWLSALLETSDFGAVEISEIISAAVADLDLDREVTLRYLVRITRPDRDFRSDGHIVTFR